MPELVTMGATLQCSMGLAPASLVVMPNRLKSSTGMPVANIDDHKLANIATFGLCQSLSNPTVASATSSAGGVLTPMPCVPSITAPWMPGSAKVTIANRPALMKSDTCACAYAGTVTVASPGQVAVTGI